MIKATESSLIQWPLFLFRIGQKNITGSTTLDNSGQYRNIGILAHVDAGKTTTTEQMLYLAGAITKPGSVDKGTSVTDSLSVERERGISIRMSTASLQWKNIQINLIDTPGHVDFCAEVERSLLALDCAVLVISAVEGVQAHTTTIFNALQELRIPTLFFINKIDRLGADVQAVVQEIKRELTNSIVLLQQAVNEGETGASIQSLWASSAAGIPIEAESPQVNAIAEVIAENDDALLEKFLDGEFLEFEALDRALSRGTAQCKHYPILLGVAKTGLGIEELLDSIVNHLPGPEADPQKPLSGVVFRIDHDPKLGKVAAVRVFSGEISVRDSILNTTQGCQEKVAQLKKFHVGKYEDIRVLNAGDVGSVCGFSKACVGDVLGEQNTISSDFSFSTPLLTVKVSPENEADFAILAAALTELSVEDPALDFEYFPQQRELHLKISGWIQIEILTAVLANRFDLAASFSSPTIIYRETPSSAGFGFERYWMPKPCWAIIKLLIEPLPTGSGVQYESKIGVNDVALKYQNEVERTISKALKQGPRGWEVTDLKITLVEGEEHPVHSRPGDFIIATPMAVMNGLVETGTTFLEPVLDFRITASVDLLGSITSDLSRLRATFEGPDIEGERFVLEGKIPAATSLDYPVQLASRSGGKAKISTRLSGYESCDDELGVNTEYRGISPLDRAKYILKARGAITE
ncbi:MAG: TetM/TetW/TetO/TetS family tetracycline resistance ribosomal protection protein [bacterium]|nr:TetM/TetW/TetO/TetS family tetracycline resistance ribosomal protection protein [bacterium]